MLTEKGFNGLIGRMLKAEGTLRQLVQDALEDSLAYAIDRQVQGHGLDLRRLSMVQTTAQQMRSVNGQRLSDYIKTCLLDANGKGAIGWNEKEQQYKLLTKGTVAVLPTFEQRGAWFDFGKEQKPKDDFSFDKLLANLLKQVDKHSDELSDADKIIVNAIRSARLSTVVRTDDEGNVLAAA